ncbi:MAG: site-specific integrase [Pseudomonadota bacterium]
MKANLVELWDAYSDILWEPSDHKNTCKGYAYELQSIIESHRIKKFDAKLIDKITGSLRAKGNKNSTVNRKLACLSKLLRKHQRNGEIDRIPEIRKLPERNGRIRFLDPAEETALVTNLDAINEGYSLLAEFLVDTGARVGEALQLRWCDVADGHATFWETKSNTPRTVPLTERALSVIEQRRGEVPIGPFSDIRYANFRNAWLKARKRAGLGGDPQIVPHILRHTCASRLAQNGVDIKRIQEFLGHKSLTMTLRYAHLAPRHLEVCAEALNKLAKTRNYRVQ